MNYKDVREDILETERLRNSISLEDVDIASAEVNLLVGYARIALKAAPNEEKIFYENMLDSAMKLESCIKKISR